MIRRLISLNISCLPYIGFVREIRILAKQRCSSYVCVANVHMCIEAYDDPDFQKVVNNADLVTPDGMPLVKGLEWIYGIKQERVAGMDLLPDLLTIAQEEGLSVYFYGGSEAIQDATQKFVAAKYPNLKAVGFYSPPFRPLTQKEEEDIIQGINSSGANIVFVVLGCPKQEKWMASMKGKINACMVGIGGALPVMIGMQKRAPKWMQRFSLEWLYRLMQEPGRLFKRYAYTNTKFIYLLLKQKFGF